MHSGGNLRKARIETKRLVPEEPKQKQTTPRSGIRLHGRIGKVIFQTICFFVKDFRQRQRDEKGGWRENLNDVRLPPFRLSILIQALKARQAHGEQSRGERTNTGKAGEV
jgi:hypothetical protein